MAGQTADTKDMQQVASKAVHLDVPMADMRVVMSAERWEIERVSL